MRFLIDTKHATSSVFTLAMLAFGLAACGGDSDDLVDFDDADAADQTGAVFAMTNAVAGNEVVVFERADDGGITSAGSFATGGAGEGRGGPSPFPFAVSGTSDPLVLSADNQQLYVVNPGSDDITAFAVEDDTELSVIDTQSAVGSLGSERPISLAIREDLLYVLNAGTQPDGSNPGSITGFTIDDDGGLDALPGSTQPLTGSAIDPSQISFTPDGDTLVVTDKTSQTILTYPVDEDGVVDQAIATTSEGQTPFGFGFTSGGTLVVSDANVEPGAGPVANGGAVSSYALDGTDVTAVSSRIAADGTATCWIAITDDDQYAYATNTFSGSVVGYAIADDGSLSRLEDGDQGLTTVTTEEGPEVLDLAIVGNEYLYVADATSGSIFAFAIEDDGDLTAIDPDGTGLPNSFVGVAAF